MLPPLTRESRSLVALVLAVALLGGGLAGVTGVVYGVVWAALPDTLSPAPWQAAIGVLVALGVLLLARGPARSTERDLWHHLAVAACWLALVLVMLSVLAGVGAWYGTWPDSPYFGWTAYAP